MARVRNKAGSFPSDHPIDRGIHIGPVIRATPPARDLGLEAVTDTFSQLQVDPEWSVREARGFTWWGSRFATRVWAEPPVEDRGFLLTRLRAETDLVRGARPGPETDRFLASAACLAGLAGVVRDAAEPGTLRLHTSVFVHSGTFAAYLRVFRTAAALQAEEAFRTASTTAGWVGGEPAETPHPTSGFRETPDDMLGLPRALAAEDRERSPWSGGEMRNLVKTFQRPPCLMASGDGSGLAAEFPFLGESSLVTFATDERHPRLGAGLLMLLRIPWSGSREDGASLALRLNGLEREHLTMIPFAGSWCADDDGVAYVSFLPDILHARGLLASLGMGMALRAKRVAEEVFKDDWKRVPAKPALARLMDREEKPS